MSALKQAVKLQKKQIARNIELKNVLIHKLAEKINNLSMQRKAKITIHLIRDLVT